MDDRRKTEIDRNRLRAETTVGVVLGVSIVALAVILGGGAAGPKSSSAGAPAISVKAPRVVVLKGRRLLHLFDGRRLIKSYSIDLGVSPVGPKMRKDDGRTPEGRFRVVTKNPDSAFCKFIGLDYPDLPTTNWGLAQGFISPGEANNIRRSLAAGRCPDWGTELGGGIGLHGNGRGTDWTGGCVALSDEHIEELFSILRIGDPVEILP